MSISEPFIRRPVATILLTIGIFLLGSVAWSRLGTSALPNIDFPVIFLSTSLPGASPETMAAAVATPLERQLGTIGGVNQLTSINGVGSSTILVEFDLGASIEDDARAVQAAINAAAPNLPKDLPRQPAYFKANPNGQPVITLALTSQTLPPGAVYGYADRIVSQKLSQLEGVAQVAISGAEAVAVRVQVDPARLASMGLALEDVRQSIAAASIDLPKGSLDGDRRSWVVTADDQLFRAAEFGKVVVAWRNGAPVRLEDVASVTDSVANSQLAGWSNTERAVVVAVRKQPDANMVAVVNRVRETLPLLAHWLPPGIDIRVTADRTQTIRAAVHDTEETMLLAAGLVVLVIALFLRRFWATFIPSITIPVALSATATIMYLLDFTLDNLSLMALMVAIGFVVDDAIIMIENIVRLIESGAPPSAAAERGARQMGFTIVSITASLFSALVPLVFMPGVLGRFFREFSVTLAAAIIVSALVSLTLTPMLCGQLLGRGNVQPRGSRFGRRLERFGAACSRFYARSLARALGHPRLMLGLTLAITGATIWLYGAVPKGSMPTQDTGVIRGTTDAPPDISFAAMRDRQFAVGKAILADPAVDSLVSSVGSGNGPFTGGLNNGSLTINLKPIGERKLPVEKIIDRLRGELAAVEGIDTYLVPVQDFGFGARAGKARYQYTLQGPDLADLQRWVGRVRARLSQLPQLTDIDTDQDASGLQARLVIDRANAARLGVSPSAIDQTLYDAYGQRQIDTIYTDLEQYKVVLEVAPADRQDPAALARLYLPGGSQIPLSAVTAIQQGLAPVTLNHQGQLPAITIGFNTRAGVPVSDAMDAIDATVAQLHLPGEITAGFAGDAFEIRQSNATIPILLLSALIAMYLVLGILYESYAHPLTILSTLPSAGLGALLALLATHTEFSLVAVVGIVLLIGIVKKNAILMVDFALVAERELGLTPREAIQKAALLRLRPITMTTLAAGLGALPIALGMGVGSELRQPLGITIIGGLLVSQIVTLYTTPVVYLAVDRLRGRKRRRPRWLDAELPAE